MASAGGKKAGTKGTRAGASRGTGSAAKGRNGSGNTNSTSRRNTKTTGGRGSRQTAEEDGFMGTEVAIIASFAVSVLLFLSNFRLCGAAGDACRSFMLGVFGTIGFIAPVLLFSGTCFYLSNRGDRRAVVKLVAVLIVLLALCGLAQMIFGGGYLKGQALNVYYKQSGATGSGGGLIGGSIVSLLCTTLGSVGAYVVLLVSLIIGIVCITEKSLVNFVKSNSGRAYQYAREDMDRRRVIHEEQRAARRLLREEQRVRGVDLGATTLSGSVSMEQFAAGSVEDEFFGQVDPLPDIDIHANPADIFRGNISAPSYINKEETENDLEQTSEEIITSGSLIAKFSDMALLKSGRADKKREDENDVYIRKDMRTLQEMSLSPDHFEQDSYDEEELSGSTLISDDFADVENVMDAIDAVDENGFYEIDPVEEKEEAVNYDSFFVPEGPKTVVTASGKVIETDTEALRKTLEKKREVKTSPPVEAPPVIEEVEKKEYQFPPLHLLKKGVVSKGGFSDKEYKETAIKLQKTLQNFGVGVTVTDVSCGPSVTRYELSPEQGVKVSKIVSLADDIKLNLAAADIRIEAPIPGKAAVGIEVPNKENNVVLLRDLLEAEEFKRHSSSMAFAVGKDIGGKTVVTDIAKMPHLLIAGATGSGKSVCINTLIMSIIYKARPEDVKLIMIDPKVVELSVYNGIPHLMIPVVTDPKKASGALNWAVAEMTDRYQKFAKYNVRDLKGFNAKVESVNDIEDENKQEKLPQIIIIVDELADLMMVAPGEVEDSICRLAQLARAAGIHLVIATQRPSVNVITGLIKANIPSRIAFSVSSGVDSRTIIDMNGAEKLLGKGDMLFYPSGVQKPQRVQGAFVSDQEVSQVVEFLTEQGLTADYSEAVETQISSASLADGGSGKGDRDDYFEQAGRFIIEKDKASIGMLQRMFKIGFNRAARIMDQLAEANVVGEEEGTKPRKVLMTMEEFEQLVNG